MIQKKQFLSSLAWAKVRELPEELQADARRAWLTRWQRLLACTAAKAFAMSLLGLVTGGSDGAIHECTRPSVRRGMREQPTHGCVRLLGLSFLSSILA